MAAFHNNHSSHNIDAGFTLLEVMIAVVILAIGLTTLFGSQSQSVSLAGLAKFNTIAPQLAQLKLSELKIQEEEITTDNGDFEDGFEDYSWAVEVDEPSLGDSDILSEIAENLQKVTLTISYAENSHQFIIESYFLVEPVQ